MKRILTILGILILPYMTFSQVTKEDFFKVCDSLKIHHPYVVWAQAKLESGNFKSKTFINKGNCLGIYDSFNKCYASFTSWKECLNAYKTRFQYKCENSECTDEEYLLWLVNAGYAEDQSYYEKVLRIIKIEKSK